MTDVVADPDFLPVGTVRYELHKAMGSQRCCVKRVETVVICESREEARQWMIDNRETRDERDQRIDDMRIQVTAHDNAAQADSKLSTAMMAALSAMPIRCPNGLLPPHAPSGGTLQALEKRDLIMRVEIGGEPRWLRTMLGEAVWENR